MKARIISCDIHDYFEIACMRHSQVLITTHDGQEHLGIAKDLETKNKHEFLHLKVEGCESVLKIDLLNIKTLQVEGDNEPITVSSAAC